MGSISVIGLSLIIFRCLASFMIARNMLRIRLGTCLVTAGLTAGLLPARAEEKTAEPLPLKKVVLYNAGVGFYERRADVLPDERARHRCFGRRDGLHRRQPTNQFGPMGATRNISLLRGNCRDRRVGHGCHAKGCGFKRFCGLCSIPADRPAGHHGEP